MIADPPPLESAVADPAHARGDARWPCWVEVDLDAVAHNVQQIQRQARPRLGVTAVVKAQAYGLGATAVARAAIEAGAIRVAVARTTEAAQLRQNGIDAPILVMGAIAPAEARDVVRLRLTPTVADWATAQLLAAATSDSGQVLGVDVKVDTGMNRYGASPSDAIALTRALTTLPTLRLDGFFTHFAAADEKDLWFSSQQIAYFRAICSQLEAEGLNLGIKHAANSAGSIRIPDCGFDSVRIGIALSGSHATRWVPREPTLRPAVALKSRVARLLAPTIGASIGYGRTFKVEQPMRTALISCGYADGLPRACSNNGDVLIRGQRCRLVGTVSMDMAMADITHLRDEVAFGDEVVILGRQGDEAITVEELSNTAGILPHELLVRLGGRAPRVYLRDGQAESAARLTADDSLPL